MAMIKDHIWNRTMNSAKYIFKTGASVQDTAKVFGVSPSTVWQDLKVRLPKIHPELAKEVALILSIKRPPRQ